MLSPCVVTRAKGERTGHGGGHAGAHGVIAGARHHRGGLGAHEHIEGTIGGSAVEILEVPVNAEAVDLVVISRH